MKELRDLKDFDDAGEAGVWEESVLADQAAQGLHVHAVWQLR